MVKANQYKHAVWLQSSLRIPLRWIPHHLCGKGWSSFLTYRVDSLRPYEHTRNCAALVGVLNPVGARSSVVLVSYTKAYCRKSCYKRAQQKLAVEIFWFCEGRNLCFMTWKLSQCWVNVTSSIYIYVCVYFGMVSATEIPKCSAFTKSSTLKSI